MVDFSLNEIKLLKVHERSSRQCKGCRLSFAFSNRSTNSLRVPTLDEMILLVKGLSKSFGHNIGLYIELKAPDFHQKYKLDPAKTLLNLLNHHGYQEASDPIFIQSFDSKTLKSLRYEHKTKT